MLKILLKKQLYELNSSFFYDRKKGKARAKSTSILFIVLYALLMIVVIGGMFAAMSFMLCKPFVGLGLDWLYFDMMTLMALFLGVFGGVFNTYSSLYKAKDNDLMLSLPVPTKYILLSRLMGVYLMGLCSAPLSCFRRSLFISSSQSPHSPEFSAASCLLSL